MSTGTTSPPNRESSSPASVKVETARLTSPRAKAIGLPASAQISSAISSLRARMPSAIARRTSRRR